MSDPIFHDEKPMSPLAEVGRYPRLNEARERGLVVAAMGRPHWILRQGREYVLSVEEADRESVLAAVSAFEGEEQARKPAVEPEPLKIPVFAVVMTVLGLVLAYAVQKVLPASWVELGVADDLRIRAGEWWRCVTALFLHGDAEHLGSNLSLGIFVCAFVYARFGSGVGLFATILAGAAGNAFNALAHWGVPHRSIGSSTALFAGLGLLAGGELAARLRQEQTRGRWSLIVPLGAGLTFLSLYGGAGTRPDGTVNLDSRVDIMAHLFGLLAGFALGTMFFAFGARRGISNCSQRIFGLATLVLVVAAWSWALAMR